MVGGQEYTELLVRHPDGTYIKDTHWDIPGIIVSLRLTTRFDTEGNKVLFIEEIQSDWTSEAHKLRKKEVLRVAKELQLREPLKTANPLMAKMFPQREFVPVPGEKFEIKEKYIKQAEKKVPKDFGYVSRKTQAEYDKARKELSNYIKKENLDIPIYNLPELPTTFIEKLEDKQIDNYRKYYAYGANKTQARKIMELHSKVSRLKPSVQTGGFQDTPYKDGWIKLGVKKAILHAVNNNFDKIAVPTHEQIADMFDVSKSISTIRYKPIDPNAKRSDAGYGRFRVFVNDKRHSLITSIPQYNTPEQLENYLGKGIVDRMLAGEGVDFPGVGENGKELSGLDLRTPARFHKLVYDALANTLAKQGKRLGGKSGTTDIEFTGGEVTEGKEANIPEDLIKSKGYEKFIEEAMEGDATISVKRKSLDLTDNLKDKVRRTGIPSFQLKPVGEPLKIYDDITGKESFGLRPKGPRKLIKAWESGIIPISTLLKRIDPKIYSFLLKHQYNIAIRTNQAKEDIILLDKMIKRMSKKDQAIFKLAMLNSDGATLRNLAGKYDKNEDFTLALMNVRNVLDELREQLIEVGEEVGFIEEYYPRKVTDYDGLIGELYGDTKVKALIEKQIAEKEKNEERKLSDSEKADLINKLIRGYSYIKSRPSFIKTRKLDTITPKIAEFYEDPIIQLNNHMERVVERIENKRFFGASETSDESLGDFIQKIIDSGITLTDAQQKDLMRIFGAYFNFEPTNSTLGAIKTGTYGILLGRWTNTITQMQDMVYGIYENKWNQIRTIKNLVNYFKGKIVETERVKRADVGADMIGQETW
jgi:hypothetical protein